jgi:LacI family transcriptional regulator
MATIRDVARRAGVGTGTISRLLNDPKSVSPATRKRIEEAIAALGYRPNQMARSLSLGRTMTVGLVIPDIANPFFPQITRGLTDSVRATGYEVLLANSDGDPNEEHSLLETLASRVDGIVLAPAAARAPAARPPLPLVLVDRGWRGDGADRVTAENREAMRRLVQRLFDGGHRAFAFLGGPPDIDTAAERRAGFEDAVEGRADVSVHWTAGPFRMESGYDRTRALLRAGARFTAVVAANDMLAAGALRALSEASVRVPAEVSLTGFDNLPWAALLTPALTTVDQSAYALGREAGELLLTRLAGGTGPPVTRRLAARIVWRDSASGVPAAPLTGRKTTGGGESS